MHQIINIIRGMNTEKMNIFGLLKNLWPFVKPYRLLIFATITLTFVG